MGKDWRDVKNSIEDEIDRIWDNPPEELVSGMRGEFKSGAGVGDFVYGNMFYLTFETSKIGRHIVQPGISASLADESISLEAIKKMWQYLSAPTAKKIGGVAPGCPAPWLNLKQVSDFWADIEDCMDSIKTREDLKSLFYSWVNYLSFLNAWGYVLFPWDYSWDKLPLKTERPEGLEVSF